MAPTAGVLPLQQNATKQNPQIKPFRPDLLCFQTAVELTYLDRIQIKKQCQAKTCHARQLARHGQFLFNMIQHVSDVLSFDHAIF